MSINSFIPLPQSPTGPRQTNPPERIVHRRVSANGAITQVEFGSDGVSRTLDTPAPNLFDLFGGLQPAKPPVERPKPSSPPQGAQDTAAAVNQAAQLAAESVDAPATQDELDAANAECAAREDPAPGESDGATPPPHFFAPTVAGELSSDSRTHRAALQQLVSQLSVRLSVQDSRAEIALHALIDGFPSTVVTMQQIGARLQVTCRCNSPAEAAWFAEHGSTLSALLSDRLHRSVDVVTDKQSASDDAATDAREGRDATG